VISVSKQKSPTTFVTIMMLSFLRFSQNDKKITKQDEHFCGYCCVFYKLLADQ